MCWSDGMDYEQQLDKYVGPIRYGQALGEFVGPIGFKALSTIYVICSVWAETILICF